MSCIKDALEYALHAFEHLHNTQTYQGDNQDFSDEIITMRAALAELEQAQKQEPAQAAPYGWHVTGLSCLMVGEYAEHDAKAVAKRCGGTPKAIPLYTHPAPFDSDTQRMVLELCDALTSGAVISMAYANAFMRDLYGMASQIKERLEAGE